MLAPSLLLTISASYGLCLHAFPAEQAQPLHLPVFETPSLSGESYTKPFPWFPQCSLVSIERLIKIQKDDWHSRRCDQGSYSGFQLREIVFKG